MKFNSLKATALLGLVASISMAQANTFSGAGPYNSDGPVASAGNGSFGGVTATTMLASSLRIQGNLNDGGVGSFLSEARWNITNQTFGVSLGVQSAVGNTWSGTQAVDSTISVLAWMTAGDNYNFEAFESFNDSGVDANWTDVSFTFAAGTVTSVGSYAAGAFVFDTEGSDAFDSEIALYSSSGTLLGTDDDAGTGNLSSLAATLGLGSYYLVSGGFNSQFGNGIALPGTAVANVLNTNINGVSVGSSALAARQFHVYSFNVVPEPGSALALGLGAVALLRRKKK
ncbi:MAG: PEP-CTERM sorting domain-containing protein [Chthonomonas sp.]|nr:PEP-CTERM sorting domain-containing protein [Chthonomonas sp.]